MEKTVLSMPDGCDIDSGVEALREHFDLETVVKYFRSGELLKWMNERYYDDIADELEKLNPDAPDMERKLCAILGVKAAENNDSKQRTAEKLALLRQQTDDEAILSKAALTAFSQGDLAELLDAGENVIYLCGEVTFSIPVRKTGKRYIGILGAPKVNVKASSLEELNDRDITFENVTLPDKLCESSVAADPTGENQSWAPLSKEELLVLFQKSVKAHPMSKVMAHLPFVMANLPFGNIVESLSSENSNSDSLKLWGDLSNSTMKPIVWEIMPYGNADSRDNTEKNLFLRLVCKGKYAENELIHVYVDSGLTEGLVLTTDSICVHMQGVDAIIPYCKIENAEATGNEFLDRRLSIQYGSNHISIGVDSNYADKENSGFSGLIPYEALAEYLMTVKKLSNIQA